MEGDIIDLLVQLKKEQLTPTDLSLEDIKGVLMVIFHFFNLSTSTHAHTHIRIYMHTYTTL